MTAIRPFGGYVAQYLGDGLLLYFGWPQAHEDAAVRAVYASLAIVEAMAPLNTRVEPRYGVRVAVRLGLHTGLAVIGQMGSGVHQEQLAMDDTPNIAARLQSLAAPNTVVLSQCRHGATGARGVCAGGDGCPDAGTADRSCPARRGHGSHRSGWGRVASVSRGVPAPRRAADAARQRAKTRGKKQR